MTRQADGGARRPRRSRTTPAAVAVLAALVAVVLGAGPVVTAAPASAASGPVATGIALAPSASCRWGDVDITYAAGGAERRTVQLTAADGTTLSSVEGKVLSPTFDGTEHVLSEAKAPPPAGTVVAVHVTVGTVPPAAGTTAELLLVYRCDARSTREGGTNQVLSTCAGAWGTCPATAAGAVADPPVHSDGSTGPFPAAGAGTTSSGPTGSGSSGPSGSGSSGSSSSGGGGAVGGSIVPGTVPVGTAVGPGASGATAPAGSTPGTAAPNGGGAAAPAATADTSTGSGLPWVLAALVVLLAGAAGVIVVRRRRAGATG